MMMILQKEDFLCYEGVIPHEFHKGKCLRCGTKKTVED